MCEKTGHLNPVEKEIQAKEIEKMLKDPSWPIDEDDRDKKIIFRKNTERIRKSRDFQHLFVKDECLRCSKFQTQLKKNKEKRAAENLILKKRIQDLENINSKLQSEITDLKSQINNPFYFKP